MYWHGSAPSNEGMSGVLSPAVGWSAGGVSDQAFLLLPSSQAGVKGGALLSICWPLPLGFSSLAPSSSFFELWKWLFFLFFFWRYPKLPLLLLTISKARCAECWNKGQVLHNTRRGDGVGARRSARKKRKNGHALFCEPGGRPGADG